MTTSSILTELLVGEIDTQQSHFWFNGDFWIFILLGVASVLFSVLSFREAKAAKKAATEAGQVVKIQTITIELSELVQKLDVLDTTIDFGSARDFYSETNRRIMRIIAPFSGDDDYSTIIDSIRSTLAECRKNLASVKPVSGKGDDVSNSVYHAVESSFSKLSGQLAELMGLFEKRTIS